MLQFEEGITLIGLEGCVPCDAIKACFGRRDDFAYIDFRALPDADQASVRTKVVMISTVGVFSLPAVVIVQDGVTTWYSNNDESIVSDMIEAIHAHLSE